MSDLILVFRLLGGFPYQKDVINNHSHGNVRSDRQDARHMSPRRKVISKMFRHGFSVLRYQTKPMILKPYQNFSIRRTL